MQVAVSTGGSLTIIDIANAKSTAVKLNRATVNSEFAGDDHVIQFYMRAGSVGMYDLDKHSLYLMKFRGAVVGDIVQEDGSAYWLSDSQYVYKAKTGDPNAKRLSNKKLSGAPSGMLSVSGSYLVYSTVDGRVGLIEKDSLSVLPAIETPDKRPVEKPAAAIGRTVYLVCGGVIYAVDVR